LILSKTLKRVKADFNSTDIISLQKEALAAIGNEDGVEPDYFELVDGDTLYPANQNTENIVALVAAKVGNTRLIDNVII
ncbi:MAG: pantoate--beta-alanine ligase, partial [Sphingobacteriaceae bacterium]